MPAARLPIRSRLAVFPIAALALTGRAHASTTVPAAAVSVVSPAEVVVHRSPSCDCCHEHIAHLRAAGFDVRDEAWRT